MELLLGLDVGTTATKALLFDLNGRVVDSASQPYTLITPHEGWVEQDPEALWQAVITTIRSLTQQRKPADRILALCQSSQGGTTIPTDYAGVPVHNAISWMDLRARQDYELLKQRLGAEAIYTKTGWPLIAGLPLLHISWLRQNQPQKFNQTRHFLFVNDFIGLRLTGELCMNPSDASITQLFSVENCDWDDELIELAGIQREQLSPVYPSGYVFGSISASASAATGLPQGLPVVNGAHDQYCTAVGLGVTKPGPMQLSSGTAWVLLAVPESLEIGLRSKMAVSCHAVRGRWGALRSLGAVGTSFEWFVDYVWGGQAHMPIASTYTK